MPNLATRLFMALSLAALAALAAGCASGLPPDVAKLGYVHRQLRFAMNVPAGWTIRDTSGTAAVFVVGPTGADGMQPNVNVVVESGGAAVTLEELARTCQREAEALKGFKLLGNESCTLAGNRKAWVLTFEHSALGQTLRERQLLVLAGNRSYIVTATASPEAFAANEADFETVLKSFRAGW